MNEASANEKSTQTQAKASAFKRMVRVNAEREIVSIDDNRTASLVAHQLGLVNKTGSFITSTNKYTMNKTNQKEIREEWITRKALTLAKSQGYSEDTAYAFAAFAIERCPEVQGFQNLFDYYMSKQDFNDADPHRCDGTPRDAYGD